MKKKNYDRNLDFINLFLDKLYTEKNLSKNTLESYNKDLIDLIKYLEKKCLTIENCCDETF